MPPFTTLTPWGAQFNKCEAWERRGSAIYTEEDGTPGKAKLIAELHPAHGIIVQYVVDAHNAALAAALNRRN